jgi:hypothetical protein
MKSMVSVSYRRSDVILRPTVGAVRHSGLQMLMFLNI